jgi:hypothetical protein
MTQGKKGCEVNYFTLDNIDLSPVDREEFYEMIGTAENPFHHAWNIRCASLFPRVHGLRGDKSQFCRLPVHARMIPDGGIEINEEYARSDKVDPRRPVLMVTIDKKDYVIDGWHRIHRAVLMGWECVPAFILKPGEDYFCRVCPCCMKGSTYKMRLINVFK